MVISKQNVEVEFVRVLVEYNYALNHYVPSNVPDLMWFDRRCLLQDEVRRWLFLVWQATSSEVFTNFSSSKVDNSARKRC